MELNIKFGISLGLTPELDKQISRFLDLKKEEQDAWNQMLQQQQVVNDSLRESRQRLNELTDAYVRNATAKTGAEEQLGAVAASTEEEAATAEEPAPAEEPEKKPRRGRRSKADKADKADKAEEPAPEVAPEPEAAPVNDEVSDLPFQESEEELRKEMSISQWKEILHNTMARLGVDDGGEHQDKKRDFVQLVKKIAGYYGAEKPADLTPANLFWCALQISSIHLEDGEFSHADPQITPEQVEQFKQAPY